MSVLERFQSADTFAQMSMSDKLAATGQVILLGMLVTVSVLVLLWACIAIMSSVLAKVEKSKEDKKSASVDKKVPVKTEVVKIVEEEDDQELLAVITAAIAASLNTSLHNIVVTNIVRTDDITPVWGKAGRSDIMNSRL